MTTIAMTAQDKGSFHNAIDYCKQWATQHQAEVGIAEIALGAGLIAWGLQMGQLQLGRDVVGSRWADIGGAASAGVGAIAGPAFAATFLNSIFIGGVAGVAGVTLIPAIPAMALVGGAAAIFGAFGYTVSDLAARAFQPDLSDIVFGASITTVGVALLIDGTRRVVKDERVLELASKLKDGIIQFVPAASEIILKTWDEIREELAQHPESGVVVGVTTVTGTLIGTSLAAGSVTNGASLSFSGICSDEGPLSFHVLVQSEAEKFWAAAWCIEVHYVPAAV